MHEEAEPKSPDLLSRLIEHGLETRRKAVSFPAFLAAAGEGPFRRRLLFHSGVVIRMHLFLFLFLAVAVVMMMMFGVVVAAATYLRDVAFPSIAARRGDLETAITVHDVEAFYFR
jgi:hypothetical protein